MAARCSLVALSLLGLASAACSWSRFGDVTENAPVVLLERPGNMTTGFGVTLTSGVRDDDRSLLVIGGEPGTSPAALFDLGSGDTANLEALDSHFCNNALGKCFLGSSVAYVPRTAQPPPEDDRDDPRPEAKSCLALGLGLSNIDGAGVFFECEDKAAFSRKVPEDYEMGVAFALKTDQNETVALASDGRESPAVVVGAPSALKTGRAWYYPASSSEPVELTPAGTTANGFGSKVAIIATGDDSWFFAVSAPNSGQLHLFRATGDEPHYLGCLGGTPGFGRTLTTGHLRAGTKDAGELPELVVADYDKVSVFEVAPLAALPDATGISCSLAALPAETLRNSFGCGSTKDTSDCSTSDFGVALAVGDVDGDGDGEVLVGAPQLAVRGEHGVGAVLVYDVDTPGDSTLSDTRFITGGKNGDSIGGSVAAASIGQRDVIVGGGPRSGTVALFYCSSLVPPALRGARCNE
jgi:hypothetical protein